MSRQLPLLVGEGPNPSYVGRPHRPLYGGPTRVLLGCMGLDARSDLRRYVLLRRRLSPVNLCANAWNLREAESRAMVLLTQAPEGHRIVLLGRRVARAFGRRDLPFFLWDTLMERRVIVLPHPSGLNRLYNDPRLRCWAGAVLRAVAAG